MREKQSLGLELWLFKIFFKFEKLVDHSLQIGVLSFLHFDDQLVHLFNEGSAPSIGGYYLLDLFELEPLHLSILDDQQRKQPQQEFILKNREKSTFS